MRKIELILSSNNYFIREAFNTLRTNILFSGRDIKTIVMTSCIAHEGKSTVSFELCRSLAEGGKRVLLVDADLRKSVLATRVTKERGITGLSQLLSGQIGVDDAIYQTNVPNLDIIFAGPYPPNPTELVGSAAFKEMLDVKRDSYDYIIIDSAPLGMVIDAAVMASVCDGAVLILSTGKVKYRMAQGVKAQLEKSGCKLLGVVLNQPDRKSGSSASGAYKAYGDNYNKAYYRSTKSESSAPSAKK